MRIYFVGSRKVKIRTNNSNHNLSDENYLTEYLGLCLRRIWFTRKFSIGNRANARYKTSKSCNTSRSSNKYWSIPRNDRFNHRKVEKSGLGLHLLLLDILCLHVKWGVTGVSFRWSSSLHCPMRNSDEMTIGKTHPTLQLCANCKFPKKPILYISNIHSKVVEDDLRQIFSPFGDIRNCVLIKDYITGRHKTYGFIEFATVKVIFPQNDRFLIHSIFRVPWTLPKLWTCSNWMENKSV